VKFIIDHIFTVALVVLSGGALLWPALQPRGKRASALQVTQLINRGKTTVIDVRRSVVVVCQGGARADKAVRQLAAAGFEDVVSLDGGLAAWQAAGLPVAK
jgi:hypothetical protein